MLTDKTEQQIEDYVKGDLPAEQVEELWIKAIADPEVMERIKTEANLRNIAQATPQDGLT